jgi:DNA-binding PadR family transcriptional regulator
MSLKHAVLAALLEGEASGYDLTKVFDASVANFWYAVPQQLYREVEKLEASGLIVGSVVEQDRRPNKRVFTLTEAGRAELRSFTAKSARPMVMRDELLVKLQAVDLGDIRAVQSSVEERIDWARAKLARYERQTERLLAGRAEADYLREADRIGPYLTLLRGRMFEEDTIRWAVTVQAILAERAALDVLSTQPTAGRPTRRVRR